MIFFKPGRWTITFLFASLLLIQCDSTESTPEPDINLLATAEVNGYTVELFSSDALITGANSLYWLIKQDGSTVDLQSFEITPMMDMGMMQHSTPYSQPVQSQEFPSYYINDAAFIMASGEMGTWAIEFTFLTKNNVEVSGEIDIEVNSSWHLTSVKNTNDEMYFICWAGPKKPVNGSNDVAFMVYKRESMMSFPMVTDATLEIYPYMDMGSGQGHSTTFENPAVNSEGKYMANITYSMSGTWTTTVEVSVNGETLPEVMFEYDVLAK